AIAVRERGFEHVRNAVAVAVERRADVAADFRAVADAIAVGIGIAAARAERVFLAVRQAIAVAVVRAARRAVDVRYAGIVVLGAVVDAFAVAVRAVGIRAEDGFFAVRQAVAIAVVLEAARARAGRVRELRIGDVLLHGKVAVGRIQPEQLRLDAIQTGAARQR